MLDESSVPGLQAGDFAPRHVQSSRAPTATSIRVYDHLPVWKKAHVSPQRSL